MSSFCVLITKLCPVNKWAERTEEPISDIIQKQHAFAEGGALNSHSLSNFTTHCTFPSVFSRGKNRRRYTQHIQPPQNQSVQHFSSGVTMPSLRHSYTVTEEEPAALPLDRTDLRKKSPSLSRSALVSSFKGLIISHSKVSPLSLFLTVAD